MEVRNKLFGLLLGLGLVALWASVDLAEFSGYLPKL